MNYDIIYTEVSIRYNMCHLSFCKFINYLMIITFFVIIAFIHHHRYDRFQKFMTTQEMIRFYVILQSLYIFSTWHKARSTQHAARFTLKVRYKDLFLVFFFFSFLWNLEISPSKFSVKAHNISKYISQYFQIQLYNNEICKIASPSSPLPPPLPQLR